ncbi:MAG: hypothetical protein WC718_00230 [Phycisphaerales bacterium]|jgi:hypothetical protein
MSEPPVFLPNLNVVEVAITYACNVRCNNCSSLCTQAPVTRDDEMPVETFERFLYESVAADYPWGEIKLYGGQPTMHTRFLDLCRLLVSYRDNHRPNVFLSVVTNGSGKDKTAAAQAMGFYLWDSPKVGTNAFPNGSPMPYVTTNMSPADQGLRGTNGCRIATDCGISLTKEGFWPCSPAGAAARVFGYKAPVEHVADISHDALMKMYVHCDHCGFCLPGEPRAVEQQTSPTWQEKLANYAAGHVLPE